MAVITELIDVGLQLKRQGNLRGAIEHFRQLHTTYPGNARIMFELAGTWNAFDVPEQALPLYQALLAVPKGQGLPPKDMPRLYTRLGATLYALGQFDDALATFDDGLRLHPSYRPLRVWRIFALSVSGADRLALVNALELMLESLAPSRWDVFESDIVAVVKQMRAEQSSDTSQASSEYAEESQPRPASQEEKKDRASGGETKDRLAVALSESSDDSFETAAATEVDVAVKVTEPKKKRPRKPRRKKQAKPKQLGKKAVRIDISSQDEATADKSEDDEPPASASGLKIPVDTE